MRRVDHAGINRQRRAVAHYIGALGERWVESLIGAVVERQHVVLDRLFQECGLHLLQLVGVFLGKINRAIEIILGAVELPFVLVERVSPVPLFHGAWCMVRAYQPSL